MQSQGIAALAPGQAPQMQNPGAQPGVPAGPNPGIPPDLKQLLAQQARNEMAQAAQRYQALQQALQMGQGQGKPPTVAQQIEMQSQKDMAANVGPTAQAQDQMKKAGLQALAEGQRGRPENPPQPEGQGIAGLPVEEFAAAGGGIVAFASEGAVTGDIPGFVPGSMGDYQTSKPDEAAYENWWEKVGKYLSGMGETMSKREAEMRGEKGTRKAEGEAPTPAAPGAGNEAEVIKALTAALAAKQAAPAAAALPGAPPVLPGTLPAGNGPRAPAAAAIPGAPRQGTADPLAALRAAIPADVVKQLARDEDTEYASTGKRAEEMLGLKALLEEKEGRIKAREGRESEAQKQRIPAWAMGAMGATQPRGAGLGSLLASWGGGTAKAAQGYTDADLAASEKIDALRDTLTQARLEGNKTKVASAEAGIKNLIDIQNAARAAGTSMLNTDENAKARIEQARQSAAARIMSMNEGRLNRASDAEQKVYATQSNQALQRATAIVAAEDKAAEAAFKPITTPAEDRIMAMYTKFLRTSLPPALQHMAPAEYKPAGPQVVSDLPKGVKIR